ncbi:hypothetical protein C5D04_10520 [Rathayibacter sp. AY1D2]|uniref:hypothetical protein n=1 Tax=unclassified Rathayibacter TaxID=2609250 RepID=UPI000CE71F2C|nr:MULTISPECIES: hypothetical protein [unclassified Rathayibacter]PPF32477.1 hypothetical protein C5B93_15600 [Rathayibacter sp. AY1A2]PPI13236.1 hypothetical protein C5D04_10520 [Rathayibacter sp. AY1D2]
MSMTEDKDQQLRTWAFGDDARSAAVELLIRSGLADETAPWVLHDRAWDTWAIDFDVLLAAVTAAATGATAAEVWTTTALDAHHSTADLTPSSLSVLRVAAALSSGASLELRTALIDLDHDAAELVLIAMAHAAGFTRVTVTDEPERAVRPPLAVWPE